MPFDNLLVLIDGTIDLIGDLDTPAAALAVNTTYGCKVLDILGTGVNGLAAVLICPVAATASGTLTGYIEASDEVAFGESSLHNVKVVNFDVLAATEAVILAAETPCIVVKRFTTDKRYIRANLTVNGTDNYDFGAVKVLISPYPFLDL